MDRDYLKLKYKDDYEYAYYKLKKFWGEKSLDKVMFKQVFNKLNLDIKEDELLVGIEGYIFTVLFDDNDLSYQVNKLYRIEKDDRTLFFEELDNNLMSLDKFNLIEQGAIKLQEAKQKLDEARNNLVTSILSKMLEIDNNMKKIKRRIYNG